MGGIRIKNDLFDIADRIKAVDGDYFIVYNTKSGKYELHCKRCFPSLQLVLPYAALDKRTIDYALMTRVDRIIGEISAIDEFNESVDKKKISQLTEQAAYKFKDVAEFIERGGTQIPPYGDL